MTTRRPHIVVLVLDALRAHNVSCYGYGVKTTPLLDAFASENTIFRRAFSAATWTVPSHASLLTGLYVSQHRLESLTADRRFNASIVTLPEALRRNGYQTAAFSQNMLFGPRNHLDAGFDEFHSIDELLQSDMFLRLVLHAADGRDSIKRLVARYLRKMVAPRHLLDCVHDWIARRSQNSPVFVFVNVLAPHFPWTVPFRLLCRQRLLRPQYFLRSDFLTLKKQWDFNSGKREVTDQHRHVWRQFYDACVMHADQVVGRFLKRLSRWEGWDNTIVAVTSDHGEMLGDYRNIVGHMLSLNDKLIHVPLILRHPAQRPATRVKGVVQTLDLYPSILDWAGIKRDGIPAGQLQRPTLSERLAQPDRMDGLAFAEEDYTDSYKVIETLLEANPAMSPERYPRRQIAVRSATHKYVWCDDRTGEFYDLQGDPQELHNLLNNGGARDKAFASLRRSLEDWRSNLTPFPPQDPTVRPELDDITMQRLRALGYVL